MQKDSDVLAAAAADDREERASIMTCVNDFDDGSDLHVVEQPLAAPADDSRVSSSTVTATACSTGGFDASAQPPFTIGELRAAIPAACWRRSTSRSLAFFVSDALIVSSLMAAAAYLDCPFLWPLYWLTQGTMFWALFVVGHDCGHGSFSDHKALNHFVGHLSHTFVLVPYHGWRISHRNHHQNHGHAENDESWYPVKQSLYAKLHIMEHLFRFTPLAALGYPIYLWRRTPGKFGSHFHPDSPLFKPSEREDVLTSTLWWLVMIGLLMWFTFTLGLKWMTKLYFVPYLNFVMWLGIVTYLHHHGFEKIPWYRGKEWSYLRGGLSTIDRDYGMFNKLIHDIGTHVVHHLFPQIPHYHLVEATNFIKPILGDYYNQPKKSGPFPTYLLKEFLVSISEDRFVDDEGDIIFYKCEVERMTHEHRTSRKDS